MVMAQKDFVECSNIEKGLHDQGRAQILTPRIPDHGRQAVGVSCFPMTSLFSTLHIFAKTPKVKLTRQPSSCPIHNAPNATHADIKFILKQP
jgi:hypothetical protein